MTVPSSSVLAFTTLLRVRRSRWSFRGCRVHSELKPWLILRPASWLALLSRTFTFELSLAGSPRASVEYNYVGKQSIPTTGLSPASPTALWAAEQDLTPTMVTPTMFCRPDLDTVLCHLIRAVLMVGPTETSMVSPELPVRLRDEVVLGLSCRSA